MEKLNKIEAFRLREDFCFGKLQRQYPGCCDCIRVQTIEWGGSECEIAQQCGAHSVFSFSAAIIQMVEFRGNIIIQYNVSRIRIIKYI
jgi:hypothetical protein